ncbi:urea carboxylase-associated family protein [Kribbella turkmenica]|uniref:Urea carboxylase-associated family protein n=1 Tax=Kribbella turkmenica TaxID=2530375 RepID=A0A4R4WRN2_9ACTN|nr:urea carboxylase-associated family protein [Kribbella turkmenica]TDD18530.1 urea carboxylase-associated family protein [Kribbella turkmenica]
MVTETLSRRVVVPARSGRAIRVGRGERFRVVDLAGAQVGDLFAFGDDGRSVLTEHLSASHTRAHTERSFPAVGDDFVTDLRRPILRVVADDSPGRHDLLIAACDPARYAALGVPDHPSCAQNLADALSGLGLVSGVPVPQPVNVFMNVPVADDGTLGWLPAPTAPGDSITFEATTDCVVVVSACPQDLTGINGTEPSPLAIDQPGVDHR